MKSIKHLLNHPLKHFLRLSTFSLLLFLYNAPSVAEDCGESAPAKPPQYEGPGLDVNSTCAFPPEVLEAPVVIYPPLDGFENEAMRFPDMQAWISFAQSLKPNANNNQPVFLSWQEQGAAYSPQKPTQHEELLYQSPAELQNNFQPLPPLQQRLRAQQAVGKRKQRLEVEAPNPCSMSSNEVSYLNPPLVKFLHANDLWNKVGISQYLASDRTVIMPKGAMELKTNWVQIPKGGSAPGYYKMTDAQRQQWKLVSMHVISKQLPNWTWATFEHRDNTCYDKYVQTHDDFGYPNGGDNPSKALEQVFKHYGLPKKIADNYRLVGAMTDFTDEMGRPIILGNSVTEAGFQTTSSCVTCHARATLNSDMKSGLSVFDPQQQSYHGALDPLWYFDSTGKQTNYQTDFMWSMVFCAAKDKSSKSPCSQ